MPPLDLSLLLNPEHWFNGSPGPASAWYWILFAFFLVVAAAGGVIYWVLRPGRYAGNTLHARMAEVAGIAAVSYGLWGLFLLLVRALGIGLLSARLLMYLTLLAAVGLLAYAVYYQMKFYPLRLAAYNKEQERKRFLPTPKGSRPAPKPATLQAQAKKRAKPKK